MSRTMKCLIAAAALLLGASAQANAQTIRLTAVLSGSNETPAIVVTGATGTAEVFVNLATQSVTYTVNVFNLPSGATGGHFHVGGPGAGGPVVVNLTPPANISNDFGLTGTATAADLIPRAAQGINTWEDFLQAFVLGNVYANVHSTTNPGGEILQLDQRRGKIRQLQPRRLARMHDMVIPARGGKVTRGAAYSTR